MKEINRLTAIGVIVATLLTCCVAYRRLRRRSPSWNCG